MPSAAAFCDGRADGLGILRQNDDGVGALSDQRLDVGQLLCGGCLGVSGNVLVAGCFESCLDGGFVGLPALFLEVRPGNANDQILGHGCCVQGYDDGSACHQCQN